MRIIIIANFTGNGLKNSRFIEIAQMFSDKGHEVVVLTSDFNHCKKKHQENTLLYNDFLIEYLHELGYTNNVSLKRLYSHWFWGNQVSKYLYSHDRPDVIYCAFPSLTAGLKAAEYCKNEKVKFVIDIQDLWPEAFMLVINNRILQLGFKLMEWKVNKIYAAANLIIGVSDTYRNRGLKVNKKDQKGLTVFLGNNIEKFDKSRLHFNNSKNDNEFCIAYIGTIGYSYDIDCVIDAIYKYKNIGSNKKNVRLIAIGDGPFRQTFIDLAAKKGVDAYFTGYLPYEQMVGLMCCCDVVVNPIKKGAAQSITNKVGDYAFSGLAVINTQECQEYRDLIDEYQCGINCRCGNSFDVAIAIDKLISDPNLCKKMGEGSRKLGEEKFDRKNTYPFIINSVESLL